MLNPEIITARIHEGERYLALLDEDWSREWTLYREDAAATNDVPLALALIHPKLWQLRSSQEAIQGPRQFRTPELFGTRLCAAAEYWGVECKTDTQITGAAADHAWPYGLGGPTHVSNIVWLCPRHNLAKGVDIHLYPWELGWPDWLDHQLNRVADALVR